MVRSNSILVTILFIIAGCGEKQHSTADFITVDVTKSYTSKKELILQDFLDVEYIALETNNDFLNQGFVQDIGKEIILVKNQNRINDGDIFVYIRAGKALRKINRKGQGGEEYSNIVGIALDEDNNEMYVNNHFARKILVYDLYGNFKRSLKYEEGEGTFYTDILNYDKDNLICYSKYNKKGTFILMSKQDGSITKEIIIPFKEKILLQTDDGSVSPGFYRSIFTFKGNWILLEHSSDTVYTFSQDYSLRPFIVRTPRILSMDPGVFLIFRLFSDRYYFMETIKNEYNSNTGKGFPRTFFMYDKQEKAFFGYNVFNGDFSTKKEVYMNILRPVNHEIESWQPLEAYQLVEDYKKGILKGKLKEIASTLDEDDNPVIMLIKHKK